MRDVRPPLAVNDLEVEAADSSQYNGWDESHFGPNWGCTLLHTAILQPMRLKPLFRIGYSILEYEHK